MTTPILQTNRWFDEAVKPVRLFRDDLELVIARLEGAECKVTLSDSDNRYDSLGALQDTRGSRPHELYIEAELKGRRDSFDIVIRGDEVRLTTDYIQSFGAVPYELRELFKSKQLRAAGLLSSHSWPALFAGANVAFLTWQPNMGLAARYLFLALWVLSAACWLGGWTLRRLFGGLNLLRRHEAGILKRNRDVVIALSGVLLGVILTFLGDFVLKQR